MTEIQKHLNLLGFTAEDKVTKFKGVVTSISFDLYGCVQAGVTSRQKDGDGQFHWLDVSRLTVVGKKVMDAPDFEEEKAVGERL